MKTLRDGWENHQYKKTFFYQKAYPGVIARIRCQYGSTGWLWQLRTMREGLLLSYGSEASYMAAKNACEGFMKPYMSRLRGKV